MNLYDKNGFIDIRSIRRACPEACFFVFVGARRTGKTYTTLDVAHEDQEPYIFMRMTAEEMKMTCSGKVNMYAENQFPWANDMSIGDGRPTYMYDAQYEDGKTPVGMAVALSDVAKLRGYGAKRYKKIIFDEFIPEETVKLQFDPGVALKNAYMTINGNRELPQEGCQPPVELFLLANSNDLTSKILSAFGWTGDLLRMMRKGQSFCYMPERRCVLVLIDKSPISAALQRTALFQCLPHSDDFTRMALNNVFVNDDSTGVRSRPIKEYLPQLRIDDMTFLQHKRRQEWYVVKGGPQAPKVYRSKNATSLKAFRRAWNYMGPITPVDGENIFYNCYEAKIAAYGLLKLDK